MLAALAAICPSPAHAAAPVQLEAGFDRGARLGAATALHLSLRVDPHRRPSPVIAARLLYPRGIGIVSSGLGLASCTRPAHDFERVIVDETRGFGGCPRNSIIAYGRVSAQVRLTDGKVVPEYATLTVFTGAIEDRRLGLVLYVDGQHPFGGRLVFAGAAVGAIAPFGGALEIRVPAIPGLADLAVVALIDMHLSIGSRRIVYHRRAGGEMVRYHPEGVVLPAVCPKGGFRFRARLSFQDGSRTTADAVTPCPPRAQR